MTPDIEERAAALRNSVSSPGELAEAHGHTLPPGSAPVFINRATAGVRKAVKNIMVCLSLSMVGEWLEETSMRPWMRHPGSIYQPLHEALFPGTCKLSVLTQ